jgi:hypothetical protein
MARTIKGIEDNLASMKKADNAWADRYVRDVGWLLNRVEEVRDVLLEVIREHDDPMSEYGCTTHTCQRARALMEKLELK